VLWHCDNPILPLQLVLASLSKHHRLVAYLFPSKYFSNYELNEKFYHFGHHIIHVSDFLCMVFYATRLVNSFHLYENNYYAQWLLIFKFDFGFILHGANLRVLGKWKIITTFKSYHSLRGPFKMVVMVI
jgi:hypothetical protein